MLLGAPHLEVRRPSPTTVEFVVTTQPRRSGWTRYTLAVAVVGVRVLLAASAGIVLWAWVQGQRQGQGRAGSLFPLSFLFPSFLAPGGDNQHGQQSRSAELAAFLAAAVHTTPALADTLRAAAAAPPWLVLPLCAAVLWASVARVHTSESLLVLRGLGIQTRSTGATYLGDLVSGLSVVGWTLTAPWTLLARWLFSISSQDGGGGGGGAGNADSGGFFGSLSAGGYYYGEPTPAPTRFIPTEKLQDLLVNEAFRGFEVRYYLVAIVAGRRHGGRRRRRGAGGDGESRGHEEEMLRARIKNAKLVEEGAEEGPDGEDAERRRGEEEHGARDYNDYDDDDDEEYDEEEDEEEDSDYDDPSDGTGSGSDEDEDHVVVVFPRLLPGLDIVRTVWREARACLYEPDAKG